MKSRILGACTLLLALLSIHAEQPHNILFMISDDLACALSGYGRRQCKTPHLDRLAHEGVQFDRAYTMNPLCGPSRAAIMSGLSPLTTGAMNNRDDVRKRLPTLTTLPQFFRNEGYHAARISKIYHMGVPGEIESGTSLYDDPESWDVAINVTAGEAKVPGLKEDLSPKAGHPGVDFMRVEAEGEDILHADRLAADHAIRMLPELAKKEKPFFLAVGFVRPHVPLVAPKRHFEPFPWKEMILAESVEGHLEKVPEAAQKMRNDKKYGMDPEQQKKTLSAYHASVYFMDEQVGRILDTLEQENLRDSTIVVFLSDHGFNLGEHDCWQKLSLWEDSIRTPLIISAPGKGRDQRVSRIVEHIDLYPTLVELCGFTAPESLQGQSLVPLMENPASDAWQDKAAYTVTRSKGESLRTERWHLNLWNDGKKGVELYDMEQDPGEFRNLAESAEHASVLQGLKVQLRERRKQVQPDQKRKQK